MSDTNIKEALEAYIREVVQSEIASLLGNKPYKEELRAALKPEQPELVGEIRKCIPYCGNEPWPRLSITTLGEHETEHLLNASPDMSKLTTEKGQERISQGAKELLTNTLVVRVNSKICRYAAENGFDCRTHVKAFWASMIAYIPGWRDVLVGHSHARVLRLETISASSTVIQAIAELYCRSLVHLQAGGRYNPTEMFEQLANISWYRGNPVWESLFRPGRGKYAHIGAVRGSAWGGKPRLRRDMATVRSIVEYVEAFL